MLNGLALHILCALLPALAMSGCSSDPVDVAESIEWNLVPWSGGTVSVAVVAPTDVGGGPHPVILALPWGSGSAQLVESFIYSYWLTEPASRGYYVVAPEVTGSTLETTADELIPALFDWMEAQFSFDASQVAIVGASNGGRGLFFAALSQPDRFAALLALPGQYSGSAADLSVLAGKPIRFLVGETDTGWVSSTRSTIEALESQGITAELEIVAGQDHVLNLDDRVLMDWIDAALGR